MTASYLALQQGFVLVCFALRAGSQRPSARSEEVLGDGLLGARAMVSPSGTTERAFCQHKPNDGKRLVEVHAS
jgi:hypothetical protein